MSYIKEQVKSQREPAVYLVALLFLLIPLDYILPHFGSATCVTLASGIIIIYSVFQILIGRTELHMPNGSTALLVLLFIYVGSIFWASNSSAAFSGAISMAFTIALFLFTIQFNYKADDIRLLENASIIGATLLLIYIFFFVDLDLLYAGYRLRFSQLGSNYFSDPNGLAGRLLFPMLLLIYRILNDKKPLKIVVYIVLFFLLSYVILLTGSRGGLIAVIISLILIGLQGIKQKRFWIIIIIIAIVLLFLFAPSILPTHITSRIFNISKYNEVTTLEGDRIDIWKHVFLDVFPSSPIWGYGAGNAANALSLFYGRIKAVHNSFLVVLCDVGLLGFIPWIIFISLQLSIAFTMRKDSSVVFPATVAVLFIAATLDSQTEKYLWSIFIYISILNQIKHKNTFSEKVRK